MGLAAGSVVGFVTFLAVTRGLGAEAFGDLTAATVFLLFPIALADLGIATGVLREISVRPERSEFVLRASLPLRALIAVAALAAALLLSLALPFTDRAQTAIWLGSAGSFFVLLTLSLTPLFQARLQMHVPVGATLAGRVLTLALVLAAFATDRGFNAVVIAYVTGSVFTFAIVAAAAARQVSLRPIFATEYWSTLVRGSLAIGIATGLLLSYYRVDAVLVALYRDSREAGLYGAAFKFVEIAEVLVAAIGVSVFPSLARLVATNDARIRGALQRSLEVVVALGTPIVVGTWLVADELVTLTAGEEFAPAASALRLLMPYLALLFLSGILIRLAAALHLDRYMLALAVAVLMLNVALNVALLPEYGYKVAALTSTASEAFIVSVLALFAWRRLAFVPSLRYLWPISVAAAAMVAFFRLIPGPAMVVVMVASLVYGLVLYAFPGTLREVVRALAPARSSGTG